jgi:inactive STAND
MMQRNKLPGRIGCGENGKNKLREAQKKKSENGCKFTYAQIAEQCGCSVDVVTSFFNGQRVLQYYAKNIAKCLDLDIREIVEFDPNDNISNLKDALMMLNYSNQDQPFKNWLLNNNHQIGAFIIQGAKNTGQRWLVNKLVKQNFPAHYETDKVIPIRGDDTKETDFHMDAVWKELGKKLGLTSAKTPEKCVDKALERWKNGSLILTFYVDNIYPHGHGLIKDFWKPLEERASNWIDEGIESYLLMFLIDSQNSASQWGIDTAPSDDQTNWHPQRLIALPIIENLGQTPNEILCWGKTYRTLLGCHENSSPRIKDVMEEIWNNSNNGTPEDVFQAICDRCGYKWSDIESTLKL